MEIPDPNPHPQQLFAALMPGSAKYFWVPRYKRFLCHPKHWVHFNCRQDLHHVPNTLDPRILQYSNNLHEHHLVMIYLNIIEADTLYKSVTLHERQEWITGLKGN